MGDPRVKAELVRALYTQSRPLFLANLVNGGLLVACFATLAPIPAVSAWAAALVVLLVARYELLRRFERRKPSLEEMPRWGVRYVIGSTSTGLLWGSTGLFLFDPDNAVTQALLTFTIGGMTAGAAGTLSPHMPAVVGFLVPALTPLLIRTVSMGDRLHLAMGAMEVVYGAVLYAAARSSHRALSHGLALRFENESLLDRLEQTNHTLEQRVAERAATVGRQEEGLRTAQRMEAVGRLAGGVAHEFNNVFTVVLANATVLAEDQSLPASVRAEIDEIQLATRRGAELVRQLLTFGGKGHFQERALDLNAIVLDSEPIFRKLLGAHTTLVVELSPKPLLVRSDGDELRRVLLHLVVNARDAMPDGGSVTIETRSVPREPGSAGTLRNAELVVADTGNGMDAATMERAFEPFFTTKGPTGNTGLGLASAYAVVSQSGGNVSIDSKPGAGSRVTVTLPEVEPANAERGGERPAAVRTVLLAEDERDVRSVTTRILRREGYHVLLAEDGVDALDVARAHEGAIELLVTDVVMPRMGGVKLAQELRAARPGTPVLFITGYEREESLPQRTDGVGLLRKPFTPSELREAIAKMLSS
jgi:signal transduction histidine kinase